MSEHTFDASRAAFLMNTSTVLRLLVRREIRLDTNETDIVFLGNRKIIDRLLKSLERYRPRIHALLTPALTAAKAGDPVAAATLLRYGLWAPVDPRDCQFYVGESRQHCRKCGASWLEHIQLKGINHTETPKRPNPNSKREFRKKKRIDVEK